MRPPEFTGGNLTGFLCLRRHLLASMRPPEFTGGNLGCRNRLHRGEPCFNEAAGIHRRKRVFAEKRHYLTVHASMRPPEFTGGNTFQREREVGPHRSASMRPPEFTGGNQPPTPRSVFAGYSFNEAAGIHRRKPASRAAPHEGAPPASMRPPEFTGGNLSFSFRTLSTS